MGTSVQHRRYGDKERYRGILAVVLASGNVRQAARELAADKEAGFKVDKKTLTRWVKQDQERYDELRRDYLPRVRALAAEQAMSARTQRLALAGKLTDDLEKRRTELEARDISTAIRNLDVGAGIHTTNAEKLNDQAQLVDTHSRDAIEVLRELASIGFKGELPEPEPPKHVEAVVDVEG